VGRPVHEETGGGMAANAGTQQAEQEVQLAQEVGGVWEESPERCAVVDEQLRGQQW